jgi:hypothetical protein
MMAAENREIRELIFSEGIFFKFPLMRVEFSILTGNNKKINYWHEGQTYLLNKSVGVKFTHTVARVFEANNPEHVGYVVLKNVKEGNTKPQFLYYFPENGEAQYVHTLPEENKDYTFYLENKKYSLAADGTVECKNSKLKQVSDFFKERLSLARSPAISSNMRRSPER